MLTAPLMLMMLASPGSDVGNGRKAFTECLAAQTKPALDAKLPLADYQATLKTKCGDKEAAFRAAILAADKTDGLSAKDAQADADDQIAEYLDKFSSEYEDYLKP